MIRNDNAIPKIENLETRRLFDGFVFCQSSRLINMPAISEGNDAIVYGTIREADQLSELKRKPYAIKAANAYDTKTALRRIAGLKADPWKGYAKGARISKQTLAAALKH